MEPQKRLKVAFIHPDLGIGGAERLVLDVAGALKKQKHEILFVTNHFDKRHAFDELKIGEFPVKVYGDWLPRTIFGKCQALCAYFRMIYLTIVYILFGQGEQKPDLYFIDLIPIAIPFLKLGNKKIVYYCHHPDLLASPPGGTFKKLYRKPIDWLELTATAMADIILVNSEYTASVFRTTFPEIQKPIQILYPTIAYSYQQTVKNLRKIKSIYEVVKEINCKRNDLIVFLSMNRFHPAKRLDFAVNAMEKLRSISTASEWERIYCILAGGYDPINRMNSETFDKLLNLTREKNLEDKIIFLKSPSDSVKVDLISSCTALLYTPLKEHFGIVPLEAMLVSKPVIAMNSGGPRETVDHGVTGYLCEPTAESMAEFMYRIVKENTVQMGLNGKRRLEHRFSSEIFGRCLKKIINEAVSSSKKHK